MKHAPLPSRLSCLLVLGACALALSGCATRAILDMEGRYEKTRLPNHFDLDPSRDASTLSLTATAGQKEYLAYEDTGTGARYRFSNAGYSVDGSFIIEKADFYFGGLFGINPVPGAFRLGGFVGKSGRAGPLVSSVSVGLAMNASRIDAHYEDTEYEMMWFIPVPVITEDSIASAQPSAEIPVRAAVLLDVGPVSPYLSAGFNYLGIGIEDAKEGLLFGDVGAGVQWAMRPDLIVRLEGSASKTRNDRGDALGPRLGVRFDLEKEF